LIITIAIVLTLFISYQKYKEYKNTIPVLRGVTPEIEIEDLDVYLKENDKAIIYVGVANDSNSRELEEDLKKLIEKTNINIVYLNITDLENKQEFFKSFNEKYAQEEELNNYPALLIINDEKVVDLIQKNYSYLYIGEVKQFFDTNEVRGNND
jgi:hypothetical protein